MPDSKLVEKLGFWIEDGFFRETGNVNSRPAGYAEIALWNLCLELSAANASFEMEIRQHLWMAHGHTAMYGDDGEMQCSQCPQFWDYKREPLENLRQQVAILNNQRLNEALAGLAEKEKKA